MMEIRNSSILIIGNDITVNESLEEVFASYDIAYFSNKNFSSHDFKKYNLIILDDFELNQKTMEDLLSHNNIINISSNHYDGIINLARPFSLQNLFFTINNFLLKKNKIIEFRDFTIEDNILKIGDLEIEFGNKEVSLIKYLFNNLSVSKNDLLENIWGYNEEMETKVLENTVNKIKQKFKSVNITDFIVSDDGKYKINTIYK